MQYEKRYSLIRQRGSVLTRLPREVIERAAREAGLSVEDFLATHRAKITFGEEPGSRVTFEKKAA